MYKINKDNPPLKNVFKHFEQTNTMQPKTYLPKNYACLMLAILFVTQPFMAIGTSFFDGEPFVDWWIVDAGSDQNICLGETAQLQATGANSYIWSPATGLSCTLCPNPIASPTSTTTYFVLGDDGTTDSVVVSVFSQPQILSVNTGNPTDCNLPNGTIVVDAEAAGPLEYSITGGSIWQSNGYFTALPSGNFAIAVRNVGGACQIAGPTETLQAPMAPQMLNVIHTDPTLCDTPNGAIIISATGSILPLQYSIDGGFNWQNSNTFQLLTSGNYDVKVRNADGSCQIDGGIVILDGSPDEPDISGVSLFPPNGCNVSDGLITVLVSNDNGNFEYSIDGGNSFQPTNNFSGLSEGVYEIIVRRNNGTCSVIGGTFNLISIIHPTILGASVIQPSECGIHDGNITVLATGQSTLEYSINGGVNWQFSNIFSGLSNGSYQIVVRNDDGSCLTNGEVVVLLNTQNCIDTLFVTIPADLINTVCIDSSLFDFSGPFTSVSFCGIGNASTVLATSLAGPCVTLDPASGFTGTSPDLICTVHCFGVNATQCDTTFISITVDALSSCDPVFPVDTVDVNFINNPTSYCVPISLSSISNYDLYFQGAPLSTPFVCDLGQTVTYNYGFLPGGGMSGPYTLNTWLIDGISYSGTFNDPQGLADLMNNIDPAGFWLNDPLESIIFGGHISNQYGNMEIVQNASGISTILVTDFTFQPQGFTVKLTSPGEHQLILIDPDTGCSDTLVLNAPFDPPVSETINLTTNVNTPTPSYCLDGAELPNGTIANFGYCETPTYGVAPISSDTCVFYLPNPNFAGLDEFCVVVCDNNFPQICDTTFFIVNVLPETDTVYLEIPAGSNGVDTCLSNSIIELPGTIDQASFCGLNANQLNGTINGNCLSFIATNNFSGVSEVCVEYCSNGICDQTVVFVNVLSSIICEDIFTEDVITIQSAVPQGFLCVPMPPSLIGNYATTIDGNPFIAFTPCNYGNVLIYTYNNLPTGPYLLDSWVVNGVTHIGNFTNILTLIDSMNVWDPAGNWVNNPFGQTINGGSPANMYGNLIISNGQGGVFTLSPIVVVLPQGSQMTINGFGSHQVIMTLANGCADTVTVILEQRMVTTETLFFQASLNTTVVPICANTDELIGNLQSFNFCSLPANGAVVILGDTCVAYTPNFNFSGTDGFCLVVCDDYLPTVCDTVYVVIQSQLPTDTIFVYATDVTPFDVCLDSTVLQLPGAISDVFICGFNPSELTLDFDGNCVTIDLEDTFVGTTTACVIHCNADVPPICDTTYLVIEFDGTFPCDDIFIPDQIDVVLSNGEGEVCLPVSVLDINNYTVLLDGVVYPDQLVGCDVDSVYTYFYSQVFGQGNAGPYNIEWTLNGSVQTATVNDMVALVNLMNGLDPAGGWVLDQNLLTISSSNDSGNYGLLRISHPSGQVAGLTPNFNGIPRGTLVMFTGAGHHEVVLLENATDCNDTLFINAISVVDTIFISTLEGIPTNQTCIDISGLPGNFSEMTVCGAPANGSLLLDEECFIYIPANGFVGNDETCLQVCDDLGICEIWIVVITVDPLCSTFNLFPDNIIDVTAPDCADLAEYCIPIVVDSMVNYGILDNGVTYTNFEPCNGNFTQIALDTGFHEIIVVHLMSQCADTLLLNINCSADDGCGIAALTSQNLLAVDCDSTVEFCVDLAIIDLPNFIVSDNGNTTPQIGPCSFNNQFVGVTLDTGYHELIFADTVKGCKDTFLVNVNCVPVEDSTINVEILVGDSLEICLEDYDFPIAAIDSLVNVCDDQSDGNATFVIDPNTWCVTVFGEMIGLDTFCFKAYFEDTCAILTVQVDVIDPCQDHFPDDQIFASVPCSIDPALICLPLTLNDFTNLEITINGQVYLDAVQPCGFDTLLFFPYYDLPSAGIIGPYSVNSWSVNGNSVTGLFNTAPELAALMSLWDNTGNWMVGTDVNGNTILIGGNPNTTYGTMTVEQTLFGSIAMIDILMQFTANSYGILLPIGASVVTFRDTLTNCTETITADIVCVQTDTLTATILVGSTDTLCLDLTELLGNIISVENICDDLGGTDVGFEIVGECVVFTGLDPGADQACIVICDDLNICDTTILIVTATLNNIDTILIAVDDNRTTSEGDVIIIDVLQNDIFVTLNEFNIVMPPLHGQAAFTPAGQINYVPEVGYCNDEIPDSLTYEICNSFGCDTATVYILVACDDLEIFTGFSPNEDGKNDFFRIRGLQNHPNHHLFIYNRWGNLVHEATNYQSDWFGTWNGKDLPDGTYFYILDLGEGGKPLDGYVVIRR